MNKLHIPEEMKLTRQSFEQIKSVHRGSFDPLISGPTGISNQQRDK